MKLQKTSSRPNKHGSFTYVVVDGTPEEYRDYAAKAQANALKNGSTYTVQYDTISGNPLYFSKTLHSDDTELVLNYDGSNYVPFDENIEQENLEREAAIQRLMRLGKTREQAIQSISDEMAKATVAALAQTSSRQTFSIIRRAVVKTNPTPAGNPEPKDNTNLHDLLAPEGNKQ